MEITIKDKTFELKKTFRSFIAYESATGKPFAPSTITDTIMYFYCVIICSAEIDLSFDEFFDWLDADPSLLPKFSNWIVKQNEQESTLINTKKKKTQKAKK